MVSMNLYIGQWTLTGTLLREFPVPWIAYAITWGPDGALWFSGAQVSGMDLSSSYVARMTVHGAVTTYSLPDTSDLAGDLTVGPDGNIWFSEYPGIRHDVRDGERDSRGIAGGISTNPRRPLAHH